MVGLQRLIAFSDEDIFGCTDNSACNFNVMATFDDGSCTFPEQYYNCDGTCLNDSDGDGVCDELENFGCTDPEACNYDPNAILDDGSCENIYINSFGNLFLSLMAMVFLMKQP